MNELRGLRVAAASIIVCECVGEDGTCGVASTGSENREDVEEERECGGSESAIA